MNNQSQLGKNLVDFAKDISQNRKVDYHDVISAIEEALAVSVRRSNSNEGERIYKVKLDPVTGETTVFRCWKIVEVVAYPTKEISLEAAQYDNPELNVGDMIEDVEEQEIKLDRIGLATFKQMVQTKLKEFEKRRIVRSYIPAVGQIIKGTVRRSTPNSISVTITELGVDQSKLTHHTNQEEAANETNSIEAFIDKKHMIGEERFRPNAEINALLLGIEDSPNKTPKLILSRTDNNFMRRIAEREIPEIRNGQLEIVDVRRIPGVRCKIVIRAIEPNIDPIGACLGPKSCRYNAVSSEIKSEKVDFVKYDEDLAQYIKNILIQQDTDQIIIDEKRQIVDLSVPKESLGSTIGQSGSNVRLGRLLTGWTIRVFSTDDFNQFKADEDAKFASVFEENLSLDADSANFLVSKGFTRIEELASDEALKDLEEYLDPDDAKMLVDLAKKFLDQQNEQAQNFIIESKIDDRILTLNGITNDIVVKLIQHNVKTLEDLADLATDELSYIENNELQESLIMQARQICWFNNENEESVE